MLRGALAAAVTPLRDDGAALDEEAFGPYLDFLTAARIDGGGDPALRGRAAARGGGLPRRTAARHRPLRRADLCGDFCAGRARGGRRGRRGGGDLTAVLRARRRGALGAPCRGGAGG